MNWEALGVIADIIGAVAVVATLIYLTIEIRLNRMAIESDSLDSLAAGWNSLNVHVMDDPELAEIWVKGFSDPDSLDPIQRTRFMMMGQSYINHFMTVKKHHDAGTLPESEWQVHAAGTAHAMCSPGGKWLCKNVAVTPEVLEVFREFRDDVGKETRHQIGPYTDSGST